MPEEQQSGVTKKKSDWTGIITNCLKFVAPIAVFAGMVAALKPAVDGISATYGPFATVALMTPYIMTLLITFILFVVILLQQQQIGRMADARDSLQESILTKRLTTKE